MKFLYLLALVGFASAVRLSDNAELKWQPGHEYIYSYRGRLLTGLPELSATHFSGMGIHAKIHLDVQTPHRVTLKVTEAEYARFNEQLKPSSGSQDGYNWRWLSLPNHTPVPSETMRLLREPTVFEINEESGRVRSVTVSSEEPEWSVNFKKALIVLFQTQVGDRGSVQTNSLSEFTSGGESQIPYVNYWTTMEQSADGECETRYELTEVPKSRVYDDEILSSLQHKYHYESESSYDLPSICPSESKVYEILKVKNVNKCVVRSSFAFYKPGGYECHPDHSSSRTANCEGMFARSSITRYLVCGRSEDNYVILSIVNEGELNQDLLGFKSEKMLTGTRQKLELLDKRQRGYNSQTAVPSSPVTLTNLFYEYSVKKSPETLKKELGTHHSILKGLPGLESAIKSGNKGRIIEQIKSMVKKIVEHDLFTIEGLPETQVTLKALGLSKGFSVLTEDEIENVYRSLKGEYSSGDKRLVFKNVFFDTCMMSGTVSSVRFLKKMILDGEMTPYMAQSIFLSLARSIVTPTTPLLKELYELVTSSKVKEMSQGTNLYNSGILGYSTLIEKACLSDNRNTSYPTFVFGKFCHRDSYIVSDKWIPYLSRGLRESSTPEKKNLYVVALGLLSHKNVLPSLLRVLDSPERSSPLLRTLAVYSMTKTGRHNHRRVLPILSGIFSNKAERTEVRVAAFNVMMKLNPEMYWLQKIASSTWVESDLEILKLVNTAFYSLSEAYAMQDVKPESARLVRKIRILYPLIKKTGGKFPTTGSLYMNDYLKHLNVGFEKLTSWTATKDSALPTDFYNKLSYFLDNYRYTPLEYSVHFRGSGSLIEEILEIIMGKSGGSGVSQEEEEIANRIGGEWHKIVEKLNIKPRRSSDRPEGSFYLNIFETYPIFKSFARDSSSSLKEKVKEMLRNPSEYSSNSINYQRLLNLAPTIVNIPSDMGLPISIELHMPMVMSISGSYEPEAFSPNRVTVRSKIHSMGTVQYAGWVGTVCPFTGDYVVTGIDQQAVINFPNEFSFSLDRSEQKMRVKMALPRTTIRSEVDLFHYHVRPFTVQQKMYDLKPMPFSSSFKVIKSDDFPKQRDGYEPQETSIDILTPLGLGLTYNYLAPSPRGPITPTLLKKFRMYNRNPLNVLRFAFVSTAISPSQLPSIRMHFIKIKYHPEKATTKEIDLSFKYGVASKDSESKPILYHTVENHGQEYVEESIIPLHISSKPIGSHSKHPRRQEMLKEVIEGSGLQSGYGISIIVDANLLGSYPRTWTWSLNAGFGKDAEVRSKWSVRMESNDNQKYCFDGEVDVPLSSTYDIAKMLSEENRFSFESKLGYGSSCQDKVLRVRGSAKTSESQKERTRASKAHRELERLVEKRVPLIKLSKLAEKVRKMASSLDDVQFDISYERLPYKSVFLGEMFVQYLKIKWLPYLRYDAGWWPSPSSYEIEGEHYYPRSIDSVSGRYTPTSGNVNCEIKFHPERKTFTLVIRRGSEGGQGSKTIRFVDVSIPFPLSYYFPLHSSVNPVYPALESIVGASYAPVCKVEGNSLSTYDNQTIPIEKMVQCFYLLSADCGHRDPEWQVLLGRSSVVSGYKNVKSFIGSTPILLSPESRDRISLKISNRDVPLAKGQTVKIHAGGMSGGRVIGTVYKSSDETITLKSDKFNLIFNGDLVEVFPSPVYKSKLCGLCGNYNGDKADEMLSPGMCMLSKPKIFVDSYAVPKNSESCLSETSKEELRKETEQKCIKINPTVGIAGSHGPSPSTVRKPFYVSRTEESMEEMSGRDSCYTRRHHVVHRRYGGRAQTCITNVPYPACGGPCKPSDESQISASFHCMRSDSEECREDLRRVEEGEIIPELARESRDIERPIQIPTSCRRQNWY